MHQTYSAGIGALIFCNASIIQISLTWGHPEYIEICYSIEIDISIGFYQMVLLGIPMYWMAKAKYICWTPTQILLEILMDLKYKLSHRSPPPRPSLFLEESIFNDNFFLIVFVYDQ